MVGTTTLKKTPINRAHSEIGAKMVPFAGYDMPVQYQGIVQEHAAVRRDAGLFDVSHMARIMVTGEKAADFCQKITTNNVHALKDGRVQYSVMCLPTGGAIDDLTVYRLEQEKFLLIVNASRHERDLGWMQENQTPGALLDDQTDGTALIAIQGPKARLIFENLTGTDLSEIKRFAFTFVDFAGTSVMVSRTGYTGEDGFELMLDAEKGELLWNQLLDSGSSHGLKPIGLGARDTLRLEMGYILYGNDLNEQITPLEANLGWVVKFTDNNDFIGRQALEKQKADGVEKKLVGVRGDRHIIPRQGYELLHDGQKVGVITSGSYSPMLSSGIGMAYVETEFAKVEELDLKLRGRTCTVQVVKPPFIQLDK